MSKRIGSSTKEYLLSAPLPTQTDSYTVISHGFVMDTTEKILKEKGFEIEREMFKCNQNAQVAQGIYHLKYGQDPEMGMLVAWNNSYDKTMRFKFAIGGFVHTSMNTILSPTIGAWNRVHTGTADTETEETIKSQIATADTYYTQLVSDKTAMKDIKVDIRSRAEMMGRLYFDKNILNTEQMSLVKQQFKQPSFDYNAPVESLWTMYNHITYALQRAHPKAWMDQQRMVHYFICQEFGINPSAQLTTIENPVIDPKQISILSVIEEVAPDKLTMEAAEEVGNLLDVKDIVQEQIEVIMKEELVLMHTNGQTTLPKESILEFEQRAKGMPVIDEVEKPISYDWHCLDCGEGQDTDSVFHDGQLCTNCFNKVNL